MQNKHYDIMIVGAGVVGLTAALLAAKHGFKVALVDKQSLPETVQHLSEQVRTIALNQTSIKLLDELNVWDYFDKNRLGFIDSMEVIDANQTTLSIKEKAHALQPLSLVVEYLCLQIAIANALKNTPHVDCFFNQTIATIDSKNNEVMITLNNHDYMTADMVIAADGVQSWIRQYLELPVSKKPYRHYACVGLAHSQKGECNQAVQTIGKDYILGLLPQNKKHHYSVIYSCTAAKRDELLQASKVQQNCLLTNASYQQLGCLTWQTPITSIPLVKQHMPTYYHQRIAFVGDAAHRVHPLAGQGANMGLADVRVLIGLLSEAKQKGMDIGAERLLKQYQLQQYPKNQQLLTLHDCLKEGLTDTNSVINALRKAGFNFISRSSTIQSLLQKIVN